MRDSETLTATGLATVVAFVLSAIAVRFGRFIAVKRSILDQPNNRSSHTIPTPRLGGAAFFPVMLLSALSIWPTELSQGIAVAFFGGATALYIVSLVDDLCHLHAGVRFSVQFAAAFGFLWAFFSVESHCANPHLGGFVSAEESGVVVPWSLGLLVPAGGEQALVLGALLGVWIVGVVNIYNFMDGIDGLAGVQGLVAGGTWSAIGFLIGAPAVVVVSAMTAAVAAGFLTLNWPPAKIFMGDAGSTVLGFIFAVLPLMAIVEARQVQSPIILLIAGVLALWPFLADGAFTLVRRLLRRENIFQAHRSHLYQRLVISGHGHEVVTFAYGGLAFMGCVTAMLLVLELRIAFGCALGAVAVSSAMVWRWVVKGEFAMRCKK